MPEDNQTRVLIVDDDPAALRLLDSHLTRAGYDVLSATNGIEAMRILFAEGPQLVITDWGMPEMDGVELCRHIRNHEGLPLVYVIIVTAHSDEDRIVEAFEAGADDYLSKPCNRKELLARVRAGARVVELQNDLDRRKLQVHRFNAEMAVAHSKLHEANQRLQLMAATDALTGLSNRRGAMDRLQEQWTSATRRNECLACIMLDIDRFKNINDTYGHAIGDLVLKETAAALRTSARADEPVSRIGGEEFLVVCPQTTEDMAVVAAERLRSTIEDNLISADGTVLQVTISAGVSERVAGMQSPDDLINAADRALYEAKRSGRNKVCRASQLQDEETADKAADEHTRDSSRPSPLRALEVADSVPEVAVVADDTELRRTIKTLLDTEDHRVIELADGNEVLATIERHCPDVIVLSSILPDMAGIDCVRRLKSRPRALEPSVIMVVPELSATEITCLLAQGVDDCVAASLLSVELVPRVRMASRLRSYRLELMRVNDVRQGQSRAMRLLLEFSGKLASSRTLDEVLDETLSVTARLTCSRRVSIMLPDAARENLAVAKAVGIEERLAAGYRIRAGAGIAGRVFVSGNPVVVNALSEVTHNNDDRYELQFFVSAPIVCHALAGPEAAVGVLNVSERRGGRPFQPHELECVDFVCNVAAGAIHDRLTRQARDDAYESIVVALAKLAEHRDSDTGRHVERVTRFCVVIAEELRKVRGYGQAITDEFIRWLERAVPLHDIGKVAVPDSILLKPASLTDEETAIMRTHAEIGASTIRSVIAKAPGAQFLHVAAEIAHAHHERYDGTGYPCGLRGDAIPLSARIAAVADVYDALTSKRPYKEIIPHDSAVDIILSSKGTHFDPDVVDAFERREREFEELARQLADDALVAPDPGSPTAHPISAELAGELLSA